MIVDNNNQVSIYISTKTVNNKLDFTNIEFSNPGMGATQYLFFALAYILMKNNVKVDFYTDTDINIPNIKLSKVRDIFEAFALHKKKKNSVMIIRGTDNREINEYIINNKIEVIFWTHNRIYMSLADAISENQYVKLNICVSEHQALSIIDHPAIDKTTVILNPCLTSISQKNKKNENNVVFMGTLDKNRGLHVLAKAWPLVKKEVPDAKLFVIGGDLYNQKPNEKYLNKVKKILGNYIDSVEFLGVLGHSKEDFFSISKLAVLNPYGYEALPVTGIEFMSAGLPIVTINKFGQKEIVNSGFNGLFCTNYYNLANSIIKLLTEDGFREDMAQNAYKQLNHKFNKEKFEKRWMNLLNENYTIYNELDNYSIEFSRTEKVSIYIYYLRKIFRFLPSTFYMLNMIRCIFNCMRKII